MSQPFVVPVSRRLCGSLCLRSGPLTSLDIALWLGCVADALILVDDPDEEGDDLRSVWAIEDAAPLFMAGRTLLEATGLRSHGQLVRPFERLAESVVSLGLADGFTHRLWQGWEATPIYRGNEIDRGVVSGILLAQAMISGEPFPLSVNVSALARFGCRHSGLVYLRALAWLAGAPTPERWARTAPGKRVSLSVPLPDLHRALGVDLGGYKEWNRVLGTAGRGGPVHADLETAGIRLRTEWEMAGYGLRRVPVGLRITVTKIERAARVPSRPRLKVKRPQAPSSSSISAT